MSIQLNQQQMQAARRLLANYTTHQPYPWEITRSAERNEKHDLNHDFGYPDALAFEDFYDLWRRNGFASGLVEKTISKTWRTDPVLRQSKDSDGALTTAEQAVADRFEEIEFWQKLKQADKYSMIGRYAGVIFRLGDGQDYDQPVKRVPGKLSGIVEVIPCWEGQLEITSWHDDRNHPDYGKPKEYQFKEWDVDSPNEKHQERRAFKVHPDRVVIWSEDGTVFSTSKFEACYNALHDIEKIRGAGGEGFWKNAKSQPVLTANDTVDFSALATMLGVDDIEEIPDALDAVVARWSKGFDTSLMLQGMTATNIAVDLNEPKEFAAIALQEVAASWPIPQKVMIGMQTGERASTEDSKEWAQTNASRRNISVIPRIKEILRRFKKWGILTASNWSLEWEDLTTPTLEERFAIAERMAKVNREMFAFGEPVFTSADIRQAVGYNPLTEEELSEFDDIEDDDGSQDPDDPTVEDEPGGADD